MEYIFIYFILAKEKFKSTLNLFQFRMVIKINERFRVCLLLFDFVGRYQRTSNKDAVMWSFAILFSNEKVNHASNN